MLTAEILLSGDLSLYELTRGRTALFERVRARERDRDVVDVLDCWDRPVS